MPYFVNRSTGEVKDSKDNRATDGFIAIPAELAAKHRKLLWKAQLTPQQLDVLFSDELWDSPAPISTASQARGDRTRRDRQSAAKRRANLAASLVEVFAWFGGVAGIIVGAVVALQGSDDSNGNVAIGLIIAVSSFWQMMLLVMVSAYIVSRTE